MNDVNDMDDKCDSNEPREIITVWPDFADAFVCKADRCQHTCCRGWEIDIEVWNGGEAEEVKEPAVEEKAEPAVENPEEVLTEMPQEEVVEKTEKEEKE